MGATQWQKVQIILHIQYRIVEHMIYLLSQLTRGEHHIPRIALQGAHYTTVLGRH